jgi:putative peptidoglycan lipid II flippase
MIRKSLQLVGGGLAGKILGVGREFLVASFYGTTGVAASYRVSQSAVFIPVNFFTADCLSCGFLPLYKRYASEEKELSSALFWVMGAFFLALTLAIGVTLHFASHQVASMLAPGFSAGSKDLAAEMIRAMAVGVPIYIISCFLGYYEMANGRYRMMATRASLQSVGLVVGSCIAYFLRRPVWLAWGFVLAYVAFFLWGALVVLRHNQLDPAAKCVTRARVRRIGRDLLVIMRPLMVLPLFVQGCVVTERIFASFIGEQTLPALDYARLISETGVLMLAVPFGLTGLAELVVVSEAQLSQQIMKVCRFLLIIAVPTTIFVFRSRVDIVTILFRRGAFNAYSVTLTANALAGVILGLWAQITTYFLMKVLSARFMNWAVVRVTLLGAIVNVIISFTLYRRLGVLGLGLGATANSLTSWVIASRQLKILGEQLRFLVRLAALGAVYLLMATALDRVFVFHGAIARMAAATSLFVAFWGCCLLLRLVPTQLRPSGAT